MQTLNNGASVIQRKPAESLGTEIVLCRTGFGAMQFVTWVHNPNDGSCYWGHYFADLPAALSDFTKRS